MNKGLSIVAKGNEVNMYFYGIIGRWDDIQSKQFVAKIDELEQKYKVLNIYVNTDGGEVPEGIAIFQRLQRTSMQVNFYIEGIAASMGSALLALPNAKVYVAKYSKLMVHDVSGLVYGSISDIESYLKMMGGFRNDLIDMISNRTGLTAKAVENKWFDGKDHWLTAQEAVDAKLADGFYDGKTGIKEPEKLDNVRNVYNHYQSQILNFNQNTQSINMKRIATLVNLAVDASEDSIYKAVENAINKSVTLTAENKQLKEDNENLKNKLNEHEKGKVKNLIDNAVTAKKISEDEREMYTNLANADFENTSKVIAKMKGVGRIAEGLEGADDKSIYAIRKDWAWDKWHKEDGNGLFNMKTENPELYKALYKAKFDKEPTL